MVARNRRTLARGVEARTQRSLLRGCPVGSVLVFHEPYHPQPFYTACLACGGLRELEATGPCDACALIATIRARRRRQRGKG